MRDPGGILGGLITPCWLIRTGATLLRIGMLSFLFSSSKPPTQKPAMEKDEAVMRIQRSERARAVRGKWFKQLGQFGVPSLAIAAEALEKRLPRDPDGNLWSLIDVPLSAFDALGEGVSAFMNAVSKVGI